MDRYIKTFSCNLLFKNLSKSEIKTALSYLNPKIQHHKKGSYIIMAGSPVNELFFILQGRVQIFYEDAQGARALMAQYLAGDSMMELYAGCDLFVIYAAENCVTAQIPFNCFHKFFGRTDELRAKILANLIAVICQKKTMLYMHFIHLSRSNIREKLISFLREQKERAGRNEFGISMSRREMAAFLFINRSAMLRELAAMKRDKIIDIKAGRFILKS